MIIVFSCFTAIILLIATDKLNRALAALVGAIITYFVLFFFEHFDYSIIMPLLFGSKDDGYINLHTLILIIAMMIIIQISIESGLFQFIAIKLVLLSKGKPIRLMILFCTLTLILTAVLNNILAVIILIPLTITVSRILNINPIPYIMTQAIIVKLGSTIFLISSITNIMIGTSAGISFVDFFLNVGIISIIIFGFTLIFFIFLYKKELFIPKGGAEVLKEFDAWNFVPNKRFLIQCSFALVILIILFIIIPPSILSLDMIALCVAIVLLIITRLDPSMIISKIDIELILYLLGIFVVTGALEILGFTNFLAILLSNIGGNDILTQILFILWISAFLSAAIDNIPITKILIPVVQNMQTTDNYSKSNIRFYSLAIGTCWGDNLTPMGDNILVMTVSEQNKRPINFKLFLKIGFITTIYQLAIVSLIFILMFQLILGLIIISCIMSIILLLYLIYKFSFTIIRVKFDTIITKIRNSIIT